MLDKVAQGSTAVIFAIILVWWFSRKSIAGFIKRHNDLLDTLSQSTRANSVVQEKLNDTIKHIGEEDVKTAQTLGRMDSKLKLIRGLLIEVRSYQTGIPQNRLPLFEVLEEDDSSDLG
jgi:ABC-type transporter Mla subunit MlaD